MPINPASRQFERVGSFVDLHTENDEINRSDLDEALDDFVPAINALLDGKSALDGVLVYATKGFNRLFDLTSDATLTYLTGEIGSVIAGDIILVYAAGDAYTVLAQGTSTYDVTTSGGVRLQYTPKTKDATTVVGFSTVADLLADVSMSYSPSANGGVTVGQKILAIEELQVFEVAPSSATTHNEATSGGVKLFNLSRAVTQDELSARVKFGPHVILEHRAASGTSGGDFTSGADRTRTLNTEVIDLHSACSLQSNQFTLVAGSYFIVFNASVGNVGAHQAFIFNVTDGAEVFRGTSSGSGVPSAGSGTVTIAASKTFELRHRCTTTAASFGFGMASSFGGEVFASVHITLIDLEQA
jgi:hypothetical protein